MFMMPALDAFYLSSGQHSHTYLLCFTELVVLLELLHIAIYELPFAVCPSRLLKRKVWMTAEGQKFKNSRISLRGSEVKNEVEGEFAKTTPMWGRQISACVKTRKKQELKS